MYIPNDLFAIPTATLEQLNEFSNRIIQEIGIPISDRPIQPIANCHDGCSGTCSGSCAGSCAGSCQGTNW